MFQLHQLSDFKLIFLLKYYRLTYQSNREKNIFFFVFNSQTKYVYIILNFQ